MTISYDSGKLASDAGRHRGVLGFRLAALLASLATASLLLSVPALACPGELHVEAASSGAVVSDSAFTVRVANTGNTPVEAITIECDDPAGVSTNVDPATIRSLNGHSSMLTKISTHGLPERTPARFVVRVKGRSDAGPTVAVTTLDLQEAQQETSLLLAGSTRLTDWSQGNLVAIVSNGADVETAVTVQATAGQNDVRLAVKSEDLAGAVPGGQLALKVPAHDSTLVQIQVNTKGRVRRGAVALVVTSFVHPPGGGEPYSVTASRDLDVALRTDLLPGPVGIPFLFIVPGLLGIWGLLRVWQWDRRRIGLITTPSVSAKIWDNKAILFIAAPAASVVIVMFYAGLYRRIGFYDFLDACSLRDIGLLSLAGLFSGCAVAGVILLIYRSIRPRVTPRSSAIAVLRAAAKYDSRSLAERATYITPDGKEGILVQKDWGSLVLTPPITHGIDLPHDPTLKEALAVIERAVKRAPASAHGVDFLEGDRRVISEPITVAGAAKGEPRALLEYRD